MLNFVPAGKSGSPLQILCLGSHSDDIEIGCGGTLLKLLESHSNVNVHWVVFSAVEARRTEATTSAMRFLEGAAGTEVEVQGFRDGFFPYVGYDIKQFFEGLKQRCSPDLVFTHCRDDRHQDHRVISDLTWNTYRNHLILEYEIPKYDGDLGAPNLFVQLDDTTSRRKARNIVEVFQTQHNHHWFTEDTFLSMLRLRGIESAAPGGYAEAFVCRKAVFTL